MRKYRIKLKLFLFVVLILLIVSGIVAFDIILARSKNIITEATGNYFTQKLAIGSIFYLPPNFIILKNTSVLETNLPLQKQLLFIPATLVKFSFFELVTKRHLSISDVYFYKPKTNYDEFCCFLRDNFAQIMAFIRSLPKQDIEFFIEKATLDLARNGGSPNYISVYSALTIKGDSILATGSIAPLQYKFKGALTKYGISIENLELMKENLYAKLWGSSNENVLRFNGFAFVNALFKERNYQQPDYNIIKRIKFFLQGSKIFPEIVGLRGGNLFILDIDCQLNLTLPRLQIEHLNFSLNNAWISLKGNILLSDPVSLDLMFTCSPAQLERFRLENLQKIDLALKGTLKNKMFNANGILNLDFVKKKEASPPLEKVDVGFKNLNFYFTEYPRFIKMSMGKGDLFCQTDTNTYKIVLQDFNAIFDLRKQKFKLVEFRSLFNDGSLRGRGRFDITQIPPRITSIIRLKNINANKLNGILIHFSKVYGRLFSQMYFSNYPHLGLKGSMIIQKGSLKNFEFFKWLADFFKLPSLKKINFNRAFVNFFVDAKGAGIRDIRLESRDVNLNGYFKLSEKDFVSSKLSLGFSRQLMQESPKFTPLLRLVKEKYPCLAFDFQLSGNLHAMNFQWLESDFKRELQDLLPNFIERKIEKNIEEIMEPLSPHLSPK